MKKIFLSLFTFLVAISVFAQSEDKDSYTKIGDETPKFSFEIEKGKTVNIADFKGKPILINLFATWCPPCNIELP
ncbi:MAG: TlpA family protein disulfide reductase, partial [Pedobacter sp.]